VRAAKIFGEIELPKIDYLPRLQVAATYLEETCVEVFKPCSLVSEALESLYLDAPIYNLYISMWLGPHRDLDVVGDITLGIILSGDHYLFTGNGRRVGDLVPGTVYALLNKKLHGAYPKDRNNPKPLIFVACEPPVPAENWETFCADMDDKIKSGAYLYTLE
jgi:hypothetical protein